MITLVQSSNQSAIRALPGLFSGQFPWKYAIYSQGKNLNIHPMMFFDANPPYAHSLKNHYCKNIEGNESYNIMLLGSQNPEYETKFFKNRGWRTQSILLLDSPKLKTDFRHDFVLVSLNRHELDFPILQEHCSQFKDYTFYRLKDVY